MKKCISIFTFVIFMTFNLLSAQNQDVEAIQQILDEQTVAWSNNDLEGFMQGYWKSDSLTYYSGGQITKGWQITLDNYKKGYPTKAHSGKLDFKIDEITKISNDAYYVMGQYFLTREAGDKNGTFMIIFKRIDGEWKIIADSSC